jgi:hypothetical protein
MPLVTTEHQLTAGLDILERALEATSARLRGT